jgi:hypothetical protein
VGFHPFSFKCRDSRASLGGTATNKAMFVPYKANPQNRPNLKIHTLHLADKCGLTATSKRLKRGAIATVKIGGRYFFRYFSQALLRFVASNYAVVLREILTLASPERINASRLQVLLTKSSQDSVNLTFFNC